MNRQRNLRSNPSQQEKIKLPAKSKKDAEVIAKMREKNKSKFYGDNQTYGEFVRTLEESRNKVNNKPSKDTSTATKSIKKTNSEQTSSPVLKKKTILKSGSEINLNLVLESSSEAVCDLSPEIQNEMQNEIQN